MGRLRMRERERVREKRKHRLAESTESALHLPSAPLSAVCHHMGDQLSSNVLSSAYFFSCHLAALFSSQPTMPSISVSASSSACLSVSVSRHHTQSLWCHTLYISARSGHEWLKGPFNATRNGALPASPTPALDHAQPFTHSLTHSFASSLRCCQIRGD